ncbi:hypothetical protein IBX73_00970 [candidate division WOR-3 bacterium]|nr:hypothetical protein [candidate division WOR-3 bacterium]
MMLLLFLFSIDPRYHTQDEIAHELDSIANHYPAITKLDTIGYSTLDSLPIFALKISDNVMFDEDEPSVLYIGGHHAEELLGVEICMYMISDLISKYGIDSAITYWVDNRELWFVPLMNPEGHGVVMSHMDTIWRKNKRDNNNNGVFDLDYDGVDLNRNYDFYWSRGGSSDPSDEFYRGPYAFSENENRAMRDLALSQNFAFCITYHSARYGLTEVIYYPWHWSGGYSADYPFIRTVADSLSKRILKDSGVGYYTALPGQGLQGNARNWFYGICGTFTFCVEVSTTTIQPGWMVDDICQRNLAGAYYLLERVEQSGITGCIYDSLTGEPLSAEVIVQGYYDPTLPPRRSNVGYGRFLRILKPGTYNLEMRKHGYVPITFDGIEVTQEQMTELNVMMTRMGGEDPVSESQKKIEVSPNPGRNSVVIQLHPEIASLDIYDTCGRLVKRFNNPAGSVVWPCVDEQNRAVAEGIYYLSGRSGRESTMEKIVIIKNSTN